MEALTSQRLLDAIAVLLVVAPFVNVYFVWSGVRRYRGDPGRSPILLALVVVLVVVWLIGVLGGVLSLVYLLQPPIAPTTVAGVLFGFGLLLLQGLPHILDSLLWRLERGHG